MFLGKYSVHFSASVNDMLRSQWALSLCNNDSDDERGNKIHLWSYLFWSSARGFMGLTFMSDNIVCQSRTKQFGIVWWYIRFLPICLSNIYTHSERYKRDLAPPPGNRIGDYNSSGISTTEGGFNSVMIISLFSVSQLALPNTMIRNRNTKIRNIFVSCTGIYTCLNHSCLGDMAMPGQLQKMCQ